MIPLHNHTEYSALDGKSTPQEIADRCIEIGCACAACTDHGVVSGHVDFHKTMTKAGLKPILGIEAYQASKSRREKVRENFHLLLLAKNNAGLRNLWALSTDAHREGFYYHPRTDWDAMRKFSEGIICTSACLGGLLSQSIMKDQYETAEELLEKYLAIYKDNFYVELHTYPGKEQQKVNEALVMLAHARGVPLVYANDAHYARPDQYDLHEGLLALQTGKKLSDPSWSEIEASYDGPADGLSKARGKGRMSHPPALYIMSEAEVRESLAYLGTSVVDEAIRNSDTIGEQCNVTIPGRTNRLPLFTPDKGYKTTTEMFQSLCIKAYQKKVIERGLDQAVYFPRFKHEYDVISDANLVDYFLIVRDYIVAARNHGVMVGPGRGSVGGSLVAYLLGITDVDPIRYGLIFERFYNAGRTSSLPDIDTDFDPDGRDWTYNYLAKRYGADRVAELGTMTRLQAKGAIKDIGRVLGTPFSDIEAINAIIDLTTDAGLTAKWEDIFEEVGAQLHSYVEKHPQLFEWAQQLYDFLRTYSIHASAVIVADDSLDFNFPLRYASKHERMVSQWDMHTAEDFGYMKADLLRLRNLKTLSELNKILKEQGKEQIDFDQVQDMEHPDEMYELLDRGLTVGIFQIEEGGTARQIAKAIKPRSVDELGIIGAMNRPGPLRSGAFETYVQAKQSGVIVYPHEVTEGILDETLGAWLYQESVIEFMVKIGYSLSEADDIRKMMGKKEREKLDKEKPRFMKHATTLMGQSDADSIWKDMIGFASYAFNKSHSIAYAVMTLWTLYAKWKHPKEFILAGIRTEKNDISRWINEALRMGIQVLGPDVNESSVETSLVNGVIRWGLKDVKGMGASHSKWVVEHRPFRSFDQFLEETRKDENKYTIPSSGIRKILVDSGRANTLFDAGAFDTIERRRLSKDERIELEEGLLGIALSDDSAEVLQQQAHILDEFCSPYDLVSEPGKYTVAGTIKEVRERKTKKGEPMAFVKIAYDTDEMEFAVWQDKLARFEFLLKPRVPVVLQLQKTNRGTHLLQAQVIQ